MSFNTPYLVNSLTQTTLPVSSLPTGTDIVDGTIYRLLVYDAIAVASAGLYYHASDGWHGLLGGGDTSSLLKLTLDPDEVFGATTGLAFGGGSYIRESAAAVLDYSATTHAFTGNQTVSGTLGIAGAVPTVDIQIGPLGGAANRAIWVSTGSAYDSSIGLFEDNGITSDTHGVEFVYDGGDNKFYLKRVLNRGRTAVVTIQRDDGKIGINNTSPTYDLDVTGSVRLYGLATITGVPTAASLAGASLSINPATATAGYHLQAWGVGSTAYAWMTADGHLQTQAFRTDETTNHTVFIGDNAGGTGTYSAFVGENAGQANAASYCNGVGYYSLQNNTGASSNGFGYYALQSNTGASSNGFGYYALRYNTGASSNGFGYYALQSNTGTASNGFGYYALQSNTGAYSNGFGYSALYNNTGASSNGFGYYALYNNTGAYSNGFGYYALYNNTGASSNGFGYSALQYNTGAYSNGFGYSALQSNTGAASNGFGYYALRYNTGTASNGFGYSALYNNTGASSNGFGYSALYNNTGASSNGFGYYSLRNNTGASSNGFGYYSLRNNTGTASNGFGYSALRYNTGDYNTAFGDNAFNTWADGTSEAVDEVLFATNSVTITGHAFGAPGTIINLVATTTGTLPTGLAATVNQWTVVDENTLSCNTDTFSDAGTGTLTLTANTTYNNSSAFGANSQPTASNQVVLGDSNVTNVRTYGDLTILGTGTSSLAGSLSVTGDFLGSAVAVTTLPTSSILTGAVYRLTAADTTAKAPPGHYVYDGTAWQCISCTAAYAWGNLGATPALTLISGALYTWAVSEAVTSATITVSRPGIPAAFVGSNSGGDNFLVAAITATSRTLKSVGWDTAIVDTKGCSGTILDDGTNVVITAAAFDA